MNESPTLHWLSDRIERDGREAFKRLVAAYAETYDRRNLSSMGVLVSLTTEQDISAHATTIVIEKIKRKLEVERRREQHWSGTGGMGTPSVLAPYYAALQVEEKRLCAMRRAEAFMSRAAAE